jgi:hypothetical protein
MKKGNKEKRVMENFGDTLSERGCCVPGEGLTLDERLEIGRYLAFRRCRHIRDAVCKDREGKKYLTRVMRRLRDV